MKLRRLLPLGVGAGVVLLTGCSTLDDLNPFGNARSGASLPELPPIQSTVEVRQLWQSPIGRNEGFALQPAAVGNIAYAAAANGTIARFEDGRSVWQTNIGQPLSGGVGASEKLIVVGTPKGEVIALSATDGKELWRARVTAEVLAAPVIGDGLVIVRAGDNRLFAFHAADGKRKWLYQRSIPTLSIRSTAAPVIAEGLVFAGFPGGKVVAVSAQNGAAIWEGTVAQPKGATELDRVADVVASPAVNARSVCAVAFQGRVACFDLASGNLAWARDLSSSIGLALDARNVYVTDDKGVIQAFDSSTGSSLWKQDKLSAREVSAPVIRRGLLAVADGKGIVHFLRRDDGQFVARAGTDGSGVAAAPQTMAGAVLVQTRAGGLFAIDSQ